MPATRFAVRSVVASALACAALFSALRSGRREARACGGFVGGKVIPAIAVEQVLIVFDEKRKKEHFLREVRFLGASDAFGFIVPSPAEPEIAKVDEAPFTALASGHSFGDVEQPAITHYDASRGAMRGLIGSIGHGAGTGTGQGFGSGHGRLGVEVLSEQRIGSFTAFVLRATDEKALDGWLASNRFTASAAARPWLAHYVELGFFFSAFRYEKPKDKKADAMQSETVRISFTTPVAYYPYLEPAHAPTEQPQRKDRRLGVWLAASAPQRPVALHTDMTDQVQFKRPWAEGLRTLDARDVLSRLPAVSTLLPEGKVTLQVFQDDKVSRQGWGDVLLVPATARPLDEAGRKERQDLLPLLLPEVPK